MTQPRTGSPPSTDDAAAPVLSVDEAARYLRADRKTVYGAVGRGELPHLKLGRRLFISRAVLDRMLNGEQS